jgi:hypothetical protein
VESFVVYLSQLISDGCKPIVVFEQGASRTKTTVKDRTKKRMKSISYALRVIFASQAHGHKSLGMRLLNVAVGIEYQA